MGMDQHQNLTTFRGSPLAHAYFVWSTSSSAFMSYLAHRRTDRRTDRQTHRHTERSQYTCCSFILCCNQIYLIWFDLNLIRNIVTNIEFCTIFPRDAMSVRPSRSWILSKRINISSKFFHLRDVVTLASSTPFCIHGWSSGAGYAALNQRRPYSCRRRSACLEQSSSRSAPIPDILYIQNTPEVTSVQHILPFSLTVSLIIFCTEPLKPLVLHTPL